jgi:hypothetical protein
LESKQFHDIASGLQTYLGNLINSIDYEYFESITGATFCGCEVCQLRETLAFLEQHYHIKARGIEDE